MENKSKILLVTLFITINGAQGAAGSANRMLGYLVDHFDTLNLSTLTNDELYKLELYYANKFPLFANRRPTCAEAKIILNHSKVVYEQELRKAGGNC